MGSIEGVLYDGLLDALGYSENREAFRALGQLLPLSVLRSVFLRYPAVERAEVVRTLVMTGAGWEPPNVPWTALIGLSPMERRSWKSAGVRPQNHPLRRLEGLLPRFLSDGLGPSLAKAVAQGPNQLIELLMVGVLPGGGGAALISRARAMETAVNVALPTLEAWSRELKDRRLEAQCRKLYLEFPALQENTITREARRLLGNDAGNDALEELSWDACMHQGLLHLYYEAIEQAAGSRGGRARTLGEGL